MKHSTLGSYIRSLRLKNRLTQSALAELLHITDKAVSKWERDLSYPDICLLPKLADVLGVSISDLLREMDDNVPPSRMLQMIQMSHDIRTPIHIILGCVDLMEQKGDDPESRKHYLEGIRYSAQYLLNRYDEIDPPVKEYPDEAAGKSPVDLRKFQFDGKRILVVDDIPLNLEIAREILNRTGAEVELAESGGECLDLIEAAPEHYFDLILMDVSMPDMDGLDVTRRIRKRKDSKSKIPIIAMTANTNEKDRLDALKAGMNAFAGKPIEVHQLFRIIKTFLDGAEG